MSTLLKDRISEALLLAGLDQSELARRIGVSSVAVNGWCTGATKSIKGENLLKAAMHLNVHPIWLATGKGERSPHGQGNISTEPRPIRTFEDGDPLEEDEVEVARLTLKASAGGGRLQWEIDTKGTPNRFRKGWCNRKGFDPTKLVTIMADGDSMSPAVQDCASVTINTADVNARNGNVYAIDYQGQFYIKRIFMEADGSVRISSDNPDKIRHPDWHVNKGNGDALRILGRAVQVQNDI
ncbi:helix-turn-helix transcriptional regulator [Chitinimonas arctica]|uniref:Helix-turn-helix transcriptional regulator n=1 Tax=Chitinimonas arctica TaxID=2594795 RepID=A0A516SJF4_9NEIS|nr:S24 family peptidase [Chitinimonas arctica]QDQ25629.1 helix-turn-helix transcriptional regulator [Chitinimonas arctica]QDQ28274.1 helix-turn-helix transcriptional regulator [Chitinimonas arctica]